MHQKRGNNEYNKYKCCTMDSIVFVALIVFFSAYVPTGPGNGQSRSWAMVSFTRRAVV